MQESSNQILVNILKGNSSDKSKELAIQALKTGTNFYSDKSDEDLLIVEHRECMPMGIAKLDKNFPFPTGYYVICANPGAGKGWWALWMSRKAFTKYNKKTVYFSLEMSEDLIRARILQAWSDLTQRQFESGMNPSGALDLLKRDVLIVDLFHSDDGAKQTPENFNSLFEMYYLLGYRIFHFDHLHELSGANDNMKNQGVTDSWAKTFQNICKKYKDVWLFVYAQPNGASANKPILKRTDIAGSKAITQKCEFFLSLNRIIKKETDETNGHEDRQMIVWLDKSRVTSAAHIGFKLFFSLTGNFQESPDSFMDQVMERLK